jgi:hypothetical protein
MEALAEAMKYQPTISRRQFGSMLVAAPAALAATPTYLPAQQVEKFLLEAKVISAKTLGVGITATKKFRMSDGTMEHDGHFQNIDVSKNSFETNQGNELNFRDCYKFNIAGYHLDRLLGLNMTPPSIERQHAGQTGAVTWWIPNAIMEVQRMKKKLTPPDADTYNKQIYLLRMFDQLIFNTDRNLQNLLITPDWQVWMIDHTRAFRLHHDLKSPKDLVKCDRKVLAALRKLDSGTLKSVMESNLRPMEIDGILKRRDRIVAIFEKKVAAIGESEVLFDSPARAAEYPVDYPEPPLIKS